MNNSRKDSLFIEFYCRRKQFAPHEKRSTLTVSRYGGSKFRLHDFMPAARTTSPAELNPASVLSLRRKRPARRKWIPQRGLALRREK